MTNLDKAFERAWEEWTENIAADLLVPSDKPLARRMFVRGWNARGEMDQAHWPTDLGLCNVCGHSSDGKMTR